MEEGYTQEEVAEIMNVGVHSIRRWRDDYYETGAVGSIYDASNRIPPKLQESELREYYAANPDALLKEAAEYFDCDPSSVFYACKRYKITYKKNGISIQNETRKRENRLAQSLEP